MLQHHHLITQQTKRPTRPTFRRGTARKSNQVGLCFAIHLAVVHPLARLGGQRRFEACLNKPFANAFDA